MGARPPAADPASGAAEPRRQHPERPEPRPRAAGRDRAVQDRGVGPPHRPRQVRHRLPRRALLERDPVLQRAGQDRAAQLRPDQPGRHRGVHRGRRVPGPVQGPDRPEPHRGNRADQDRQAGRPRRGRIPDRQQVGVPAQRARPGEVHHLQRGRGRPRRLHEPQRDRVGSPRAPGRDDRRRLRDRRAPRGSSTSAPSTPSPS